MIFYVLFFLDMVWVIHWAARFPLRSLKLVRVDVILYHLEVSGRHRSAQRANQLGA